MFCLLASAQSQQHEFRLPSPIFSIIAAVLSHPSPPPIASEDSQHRPYLPDPSTMPRSGEYQLSDDSSDSASGDEWEPDPQSHEFSFTNKRRQDVPAAPGPSRTPHAVPGAPGSARKPSRTPQRVSASSSEGIEGLPDDDIQPVAARRNVVHTVGQHDVQDAPVGRTYRYVNRKRAAPSRLGKRTAKWMSALEGMSESKLRRTGCCKHLKCFRLVDYYHFISRASHVLTLSAYTRRTYLQSMRGAHGAFYFNGRQVCSRFLKKGFHFSSDLMAADNDLNTLPNDELTPVPEVAPTGGHAAGREQSVTLTMRSNRSPNNYSSSSGERVDGHPGVVQKDTVVSFLKRLSEDCSDKMPDSSELHLPFFRKYEVYSRFVVEYKTLYPGASPPSRQHFLRTWKMECRNIKVRKTARFTVCEECERLRSALKDAILQSKSTVDIRRQKSEHNSFIRRERLVYQMKRDRARLQQSDYCSIIVDGADQSAFGLPHFTSSTKGQRGHAMKVKLVGLLEHGIQNMLYLFTMTEEMQTGANHIVEAIHRFLNVRASKRDLPRCMFVQLDNCSRENKNHFLLSYIELLVSQRVFDVIEVAFLSIGHTHEDIDQIFPQTASRLRANNAVTLPDLHQQLAFANNGRTEVQHMKRLVNWSGLVTEQNCIQRVDNITRPHYFKFSRSFDSSDDASHGPVSTICHIKQTGHEDWKQLFPGRQRSALGFLKFVPDLAVTPSTHIPCPPDLDNINKRLISEEGRINSTDDMIFLHQLRDDVFRSREDSFHWDLADSIETRYCPSQRDSSPSDQEQDSIQPVQPVPPSLRSAQNDVPSRAASSTMSDPIGVMQTTDIPSSNTNAGTSNSTPSIATPFTKVVYDVGSFVIVRPEVGVHTETFWLGKIIEAICDNSETFVRRLKVHWYDVSQHCSTTDRRMAPFHPCYEKSNSHNKKPSSRRQTNIPWTDEIDTDSVLVSFLSLTRRNTLPLSALKKIPLSHEHA